nr:zinc finger protein 33B-like [Anopheles coluzzii]
MQCRVCLKQGTSDEDGQTASLFQSYINGLTIGELLNDLFGVQIAEDDSFPQSICARCHIELQMVSMFRDRLLTSDSTLRTSAQLHSDGTLCAETYVEESIASCTATSATRESLEQDSTTIERLTACLCSDCGKQIDDTEPTYLFQQSGCPSGTNTGRVMCQACYQRLNDLECNAAEQEEPSLVIDLLPLEASNLRFCCVTHCSQSFTDEPALIKHAQEMHAIKLRKNRENQEPGRPFKCHVCFRAFGSSKNLRVHQLVRSNVHIRNFACKLCCFRAGSSAALTIHERTHTGERPFACELCEKRFYSEANLKSHQICHRDEQPFECCYCEKRFARKRNMKEHLQLCHSEEKPYQCGECSARFKTGQHLRLHQRLHTGEKPYACSLCSKRFYHISDRKRHELSHVGAKPFSCGVCGASYTRKHALSMHERTHTGEQPFGCAECGRRFTQAVLLKRHVARCGNGGNHLASKQQGGLSGEQDQSPKIEIKT